SFTLASRTALRPYTRMLLVKLLTFRGYSPVPGPPGPHVTPPSGARGSDVEEEVHDVAVLHDVLLALHPQLPLGARVGDAARLHQVLVAHHLGADEAALEVGVDLAGRLRRLGAALDGPGAHLLLAGREEGDEPQRVVAGADEALEAGALEAHVGEERLRLLGLELRELLLDARRDDDDVGVLLRGHGADALDVLVAVDDVVLGHVAHVDDRL